MLVNLLKTNERTQVIDYCFQRYGVDPTYWDHLHFIKTKDALWIVNASMLEFAHNSTNEFESLGLRCFSGSSFPYKITDGFVKIFADKITKGHLLLNQDEALSMLRGKTLIDPKWIQMAIDGYVLLFYEGTFIGIGLKKGDHLISQIPKSLRSQLGKNLEIRN